MQLELLLQGLEDYFFPDEDARQAKSQPSLFLSPTELHLRQEVMMMMAAVSEAN